MSNIMVISRFNRKGMTLVELMVVIGVLTLLAVFIVPRWLRVMSNSEAARCRSGIALINAAASAYLSETRKPAASLASLVESGYLEAIPECAYSSDYMFNGYYVDTVRVHTH